MKLLVLLLFIWFGTGAVSATEAVPLAANPAVEQRMLKLTADLRCLVCQNESLAASQADLARDLRREVRELIVQGKSDSEIVDYLVQRYGDFIRYRPPLRPDTLPLWIGPFMLLVFGSTGLLLYIRRRSQQGDAQVDAAELARVQQLLAAAREGEAK